ncbi:tRNA glutamyl-Q(34) synthetase GluQRS [Dasania marina]|uniref:tRNA glutamyl-Q(34) synthetase GluQRS n=1 Tax=Dasania marina TaxID=471499 RepID=UPI00035C835F|nr:tRNA glutamyl-Q(34) synthetase GluQRS [Dasania marina]
MTLHSAPNSAATYIGRFAPSPTGPLHIGSLIAALASYLDAKAQQGLWLLRMEDLDPPREQAGAAQSILHCLQSHGLHWDGEVLWQSQQQQRYQNAVAQLLAEDKAFYCRCSRSQLAAQRGIHRGNCQAQAPYSHCAVRLAVTEQTLGFDDPLQGRLQQALASEVGDFVIQRKDQLFAYQLAVVLDDALQGVSHVVRGSDLLDSTPRQLLLQQQLALATPKYVHIPIIANSVGDKLSKQTFAPALATQQACLNLLKALFFLNQPLPPKTQQQNCQQILHWAIAHWSLAAVPHCSAIDEICLQHFAS